MTLLSLWNISISSKNSCLEVHYFSNIRPLLLSYGFCLHDTLPFISTFYPLPTCAFDCKVCLLYTSGFFKFSLPNSAFWMKCLAHSYSNGNIDIVGFLLLVLYHFCTSIAPFLLFVKYFLVCYFNSSNLYYTLWVIFFFCVSYFLICSIDSMCILVHHNLLQNNSYLILVKYIAFLFLLPISLCYY